MGNMQNVLLPYRYDHTKRATRPLAGNLWRGLHQCHVIPTGHVTPTIPLPGSRHLLVYTICSFIAIFFGISIIWERDLGVIHKFLASPTPRAALVLGKSFSAGARALPQAIVIDISLASHRA